MKGTAILRTSMLLAACGLAACGLAACGPGKDSKPMLDKERQTLEQAKKIDPQQLQQAEKQKQEAEKQAQ